MLVPRWHFRMLNDRTRNNAFHNAIVKQVNNGYNTILDIGTGTGLLSLYASEGNFKSIDAYETSKVMFKVAQKVFQANNCPHVRLMNSSSVDVDMKQFSKVSLIITEIFDCGIFGEDLINSIQYSADNLTLPDWKIIPYGIVAHIAAIESDSIFKNNKLIYPNITGLFCNNILAHSDDDNEPYDTENLKTKKDIKYITDSKVLYDIDLKCESLKTTMLKKQSISLRCAESGFIDAFAVWMTLKLDDENIINTGPFNDNKYCCWEQAIFSTKQKFKVQKGDEIVLNSYCKDSLVLEHDLLSANINSIPLPKSVIQFLNDELYMRKLMDVYEIIKNDNFKRTNILDLSPFPILGLLLLKGNNFNYLLCNDCDENVKLFIKLIAQLNQIDPDVIHFSQISDIDDSLEFDVVIYNWIHAKGEFADDYILQQDLYKLKKHRCISVPFQVRICGLLVESKWLDFITQVSDHNVQNYKIAEFINKFQIKKHIDFKICEADLTPCSNCIDLGPITSIMGSLVDQISVSVLKDCNINGIAYWYNIQFHENDTPYSTKDIDNYIKNAAFTFDSISMKSGEFAKVNVLQKEGLLKIEVVNESS